MSKDYEVQVKIRNARLLRKMRECGIETTSELARQSGAHPTYIGQVLNLKRSALKTNGELRKVVDKICVLLKCLPEDIIPQQHMRAALKNNTSTFEANLDEVEALTSSLRATPLELQVEQREGRWALQKGLDGLPARLANLLILRHGLHDGKERTLREVGDELGVTPERVRQMEFRAIKLLKKKDHSHALKDAMESFR